jgi:hypothetical protein
VGQDFKYPGNKASCLETLVLVPVSDVQGHNLSSYQVSLPFYLDQDFSGTLKNKANVLVCNKRLKSYFRRERV